MNQTMQQKTKYTFQNKNNLSTEHELRSNLKDVSKYDFRSKVKELYSAFEVNTLHNEWSGWIRILLVILPYQ